MNDLSDGRSGFPSARRGRFASARAGATSRATLALLAALGSGSCGSSGEKPDGAAALDTNCEGTGDDFFAGISKTSPAGVTMEIVSAEPAPPANSDQNAWTVRLTDDGAAPLEGANLIVAPFMPQHGHSAPNIIGNELGGGLYTLAPIYLKMTGLWEVTLKATPAEGTESRVMFRFCIPPR